MKEVTRGNNGEWSYGRSAVASLRKVMLKLRLAGLKEGNHVNDWETSISDC